MNEMYRVCALDELPDPGSREFQWGEGDWPLEMFVVRQGNSAFGYLNRCPHAGHPLNWQTDHFLSKDNDLILCQSHGASFTISANARYTEVSLFRGFHPGRLPSLASLSAQASHW